MFYYNAMMHLSSRLEPFIKVASFGFRCISVQVQVLSGAPGKDDPDWAFRMGAWGGSSVSLKNLWLAAVYTPAFL